MSDEQTDRQDFMRWRVEAMYAHDARLRMTAINQWDGGRAPRFYLGRSATGYIWRFRFDVPDDIADEISTLCETEATSGDPAAPPTHCDAYVHLLSKHTPVESVWTGPAYSFPDTAVPQDVAITAINEDNAHLLGAGLDEWLPDVGHRQPFLAVIKDARAVSVCTSVRITTRAHEAGVETLPDYRRRGYATQVVSAWASAVQATSAIPFYSTSWNNLASQRVASGLGLRMIGTDFHIT